AFCAAMDDDLNTPQALAVLMETAASANRSSNATERARLKAELLAGGAEIGILQQDPAAWFRHDAGGAVDATVVERLIAARDAARAQRDWAAADRLRDELAAMGVTIQDSAAGTQWRIE
ncbi:MAG: DALR domain-containing protein, partial [Gammaproteobacteria bacterium]